MKTEWVRGGLLAFREGMRVLGYSGVDGFLKLSQGRFWRDSRGEQLHAAIRIGASRGRLRFGPVCFGRRLFHGAKIL
jgi:hypothetical protein